MHAYSPPLTTHELLRSRRDRRAAAAGQPCATEDPEPSARRPASRRHESEPARRTVPTRFDGVDGPAGRGPGPAGAAERRPRRPPRSPAAPGWSTSGRPGSGPGDGEIDGALIVERNHLEWRLHPRSAARLPGPGPGQRWIVVCARGLHLLAGRRVAVLARGAGHRPDRWRAGLAGGRPAAGARAQPGRAGGGGAGQRGWSGCRPAAAGAAGRPASRPAGGRGSRLTSSALGQRPAAPPR